MKNIIIILCLLFSTIGYCQKNSNIVLKKGQVILAASTVQTDSELSMGSSKNNITMNNELRVIDEKDNNYIVSITATKMKMDMEGMGQSMSFDSDKKEDKDSEIGQTIGSKLNSPDTFSLNKTTGKLTAISTKPNNEESAASSGFSMMNADGEDQSFNSAFLLVPANKKAGDHWEETITNKGLTTKKTFTLKSIDVSMAVVEVSGTTVGTIEQEMQGMAMNMTMDSKFKGELQVNTATGMVIQCANSVESNNSMDVMGQSMQITSKANSTTSFTSK